MLVHEAQAFTFALREQAHVKVSDICAYVHGRDS
jgi:hypothetical protein